MADWNVTDGVWDTPTIPPDIIPTCKHMLPVNLFLSVFILVHNSIILMDYFPDRRKFVTSIFMLIAACDMLTAFGSVLKAAPVAVCLLDSKVLMPNWLNGLYFPIAGTSYVCSVYFNVVLSVTKTINIKNPFFIINKTPVYVVLLIGACFWTVIKIIGFIGTLSYWSNHSGYGRSCPAQWAKLSGGASILFILYLTTFILQTFAFILPIVIVFVCMVIQMYYIKKSLSSERAELSAESNHVNVTVFLVSMLFVICTFLHTPYIVFLILLYLYQYNPTGKWYDLFLTFQVVAQYTLPLINAAVYPLIIILRKPSLRQRYRDRVIRLVRYPATVWSRISSSAQEYEVIN